MGTGQAVTAIFKRNQNGHPAALQNTPGCRVAAVGSQPMLENQHGSPDPLVLHNETGFSSFLNLGKVHFPLVSYG